MNETITQIEATCNLHWVFILYLTLLAVWYLTPAIYHAIGWCLSWVDDSEYLPKWTPWYGACKVVFFTRKNYDKSSYLHGDHEMACGFFGWFFVAIPVVALYFWQASLFVLALTAIAHTTRAARRVSKKFELHVKDKDAHK